MEKYGVVLIHRSPRVIGTTRKTRALVAAVAACGMLLAGCGTGPNQAGAAAIVGNQVVSLSDIEHRVEVTLAQPNLVDSITPSVVSNIIEQDPNNPKYQNLTADDERNLAQALLARVIVTKQVKHLLLDDAARQAGITVTPKQVTDELALLGMRRQQLAENELAFDPASLRAAMRDSLTAQALAVQELGKLSITADGIAANSQAQAMATARALAAGGPQAAQALSAAGQGARGGVRMTGLQAALSSSTFLLGTPAGEVVAVYNGPGAWGVWRVTHRDINGPGGNAGALIAAQLGADSLQAIGVQLLQPLAEQLRVRVNPRYGTWDGPKLVVLDPWQPASIVLPASVS
jgi:PBP1b-binding outer membrane lipoprotein LpoB